MATQKFTRAIPVPQQTLPSLQQAVSALKDNVEVLTRTRGPVTAAAVTWQDLVDLGLISADDVPAR